MFDGLVVRKIAEFLLEIGLKIEAGKIEGETFLPGILVREGGLIVDDEKLTYPGDILHEAGHLAVAPGDIRTRLSDEVDLPGFDMGSIESGAIAWSYAAALQLDLDPAVVFHENGYKGKAEFLLHNFSMGVGVGVNVLEEAGMALSSARAASAEIDPYPKMLKWVRD